MSNVDNHEQFGRPVSPPVGSVSMGYISRGTPPPLPGHLTIVSLNVAGFKPSKAAPDRWDPIPEFRKELLKYRPHVICLQEVPTNIVEQQSFLPGYDVVGSRSSHCENVVLMVRTKWAPHVVCTSNVHAPAVLGTMEFSASNGSAQQITFGSCHLAPFEGGSGKRLHQMKIILEKIQQLHNDTENEDVMILAGDYNMRQEEDIKAEAILNFRDAWKEAGSPRDNENTWDSCDRTPQGASPGSGPHNQYHGPDTYQYESCYDRVYFRGDTTLGRVTNFQLIANNPVENNPFHYLSDHFGIVTTIELK